MKFGGEELECLLEEVLGGILHRGVSVLVLGPEISVNIEGERYLFLVEEGTREARRVPLPARTS